MPSRMSSRVVQQVVTKAPLLNPLMPHEETADSNKARSPKATAETSKKIDVLCYGLFMFFYTLNTIDGLGDDSSYKFTERLSTTLKLSNYKKITEPEELTNWLADDFVDTIFSKNFEGTSNTSAATGWIMQGPARVAQLRSKTYDCSADMHGLLQNYGYECTYNRKLTYTASGFDEAYEATGAFRGFSYNHPDVETVRAQREKSYTGFVSSIRHWWPAPAFAVLLDPHQDRHAADAAAAALRDRRYLDAQTNAVVVDLSVYNYIVDMHVWVRLLAEFNAAGGVDCMATAEPQRLFWRPGVFGYKIFLQIMVALGYMYFVGRLVRNVRVKGSKATALQFMTWVQVLNVAFYLAQLGFRYESYCLFAGGGFASSAVGKVDFLGPKYVDMAPPVTAMRYAITLQSINTFLNWFKLVNYLASYPLFALMTKTLEHSIDELGAFSLVFCIVMFGFAQAHAMMFGRQLSNYRTIVDSFLTLFRAMLGDFDFNETYEINYIIGPLFFISFVGIAFLVVLNIIIAIIADGYVDANGARKAELKKKAMAKAARRADEQNRKRLAREAWAAKERAEGRDPAAAPGAAKARAAALAFGGKLNQGLDSVAKELERAVTPVLTPLGTSRRGVGGGVGGGASSDDLTVQSISTPTSSNATSGDESVDRASLPPKRVPWIRAKGGAGAKVAPVSPYNGVVSQETKQGSGDNDSWEEL